jgi:hypothetical protein
MPKLPSKFLTILEYPDGTTSEHHNLHRLRGCRSSGHRPAYATVTCMLASTSVTDKDLEQLRSFIFMDIAHIISPGNIRGRVMIKPLWLHNLINNNKP